MNWPGWNDLDTIKTVASRIADITVGCWAAMVILEALALFPTRFKKWFAGFGFAAIALAVCGEVVVRRYEHRKDFLYEQHEEETTQRLNTKIDEARADAEAAQVANAAAERRATDAQTIARTAEAEAHALRKQDEPRILTKEQQQKISAYLDKCQAGAFVLNASVDEADARPYAEQLAGVFRGKNWQVKIQNSMFSGPDITGTWITVQNLKAAPRSAVDLNNALSAAGVAHKVFYDPTMTDPNLVTLSVGFKPKQK
ncbi:MAG TPA: hypothetical protein VNH65_18550 [Candidatus Acidoferrum sp.]|nr:hypothetical protein [Candidatus Acidoferrum sp.]